MPNVAVHPHPDSSQRCGLRHPSSAILSFVTIILHPLLCLVLVVPLAPAASTTRPIADLVEQLASDDWRTREEAMSRLVILGDDAIPALNRLARITPDPEARLRAQATLVRIHENHQIGPSLITLRLDKVPAPQAIEALAQQGRARIITDPPALLANNRFKLVTLRVDHRPFWEVMQLVSQQTGLTPATINKHNRDIGLGLTKGDPNWCQKPITLSGPLLIRADRLTRISTAVLRDGGVGLNEFTATFTVFAEPKLKVIDYSGQVRLTQVVDEKGNSLMETELPAEGDLEVMGSGSAGNPGSWEMNANLAYPAKAGRRIARFQGIVTFEVQLRAARFDSPIANATGSEKQIDGVRIKVKSLDSNRCLLSVFRDGRSELEWHRLRMQLCATEACLLDDKDRVVARSQHGTDADFSPDSQRMDLRLRFGRDGGEFSGDTKQKRPDAVKLMWEFPVETRVLNLPFEFRDLPIPR